MTIIALCTVKCFQTHKNNASYVARDTFHYNAFLDMSDCFVRRNLPSWEWDDGAVWFDHISHSYIYINNGTRIKKIWHLLYLLEISLGPKHDLQTCFKNSKNPFLPLQAFSLVQSPESSIGVHLMVVDGGSHEEEGGVGSIHTLRHLLV